MKPWWSRATPKSQEAADQAQAEVQADLRTAIRELVAAAAQVEIVAQKLTAEAERSNTEVPRSDR